VPSSRMAPISGINSSPATRSLYSLKEMRHNDVGRPREQRQVECDPGDPGHAVSRLI
jgi:hypothetical protein